MTDTPLFTTDDLVLGSTPRKVAPGRYLLDVPDGWQQGRGAFGGLVLAALARAVEMAEPEKERALRSFNGEIAGPVLPGEALIEVTELRRGSGLSAYNATMSQQGQGLVRGSAVLARPRNTDPPRLHIPAPSPRPWSEVDVIPLEKAPFVPTFSRHLEFRVMGPLPFTGASEPVAEGWIRVKRTPAALGAPEIVALADAWWPAGLASISMPRPMATVAFGLQHFPPPAPLDPAVPLYYRGRVVAEQDGYLVEMRELWSPEGRLVALNQQTIAWIR